MVRYSIAGYELYKAYIQQAIRESEDDGVISWDIRDNYISSADDSRAMKRKITKILEAAKGLYIKANSLQMLTVSMRVDGRIDVDVCVPENATPEEIKQAAIDAFMDVDLKEMEVVDGEAVNASDADGNILFDFD